MRCTFSLFWLLFLATKTTEITGHVEFTNIKCIPLDTNFADFEYCYIKAINRTYKYVSLKVNLYQLPITKVKLNLYLMKRFNGYKPFLYNVTIDACRYLENPDKNPIAQYLGGLYLPFTNMNHKCPFNESLILDKLTIDHLNDQFTKVLPFPHDDYAFCTNWIAYDKKRADVKIYFTLS